MRAFDLNFIRFSTLLWFVPLILSYHDFVQVALIGARYFFHFKYAHICPTCDGFYRSGRFLVGIVLYLGESGCDFRWISLNRGSKQSQ